MVIAQKGLECLLETINKVYKNSITTAFQPRLAINNNY